MSGRSEFRKSQGVIPFGVGAIIDFPDESLMMAGLDMWPSEISEGEKRRAILEGSRVVDRRLARRMSGIMGRKIDIFLSPTEAPERLSFNQPASVHEGKAYMPFVRFPNWHYCPRCRVMKRVPWNTPKNDERLICSNLGRRTEGKADPCGKLKKYRRPTLSPLRFVTACSNGHIMDFPWFDWVHQGRHEDCTEDGLYFFSTAAAGLAGVKAHCSNCKLERSLGASQRRDALSKVYPEKCPGYRPWLGPDAAEPECDLTPQTMQRGASNAYFGSVVSSILIPPYSALLQQRLDDPDLWGDILSLIRVYGSLPEDWLRDKAENLGFDPETLIEAVKERLEEDGGTDGKTHHRIVSEEEYRYSEYRAFLAGRPPVPERFDFDTKEHSIENYSSYLEEFFERVILIRKLRETRVLTGFSRVVPSNHDHLPPAKLSVVEKNWLPGFSVRGEGIFLKFRMKTLDQWASDGKIKRRVKPVQDRLDRLREERQQDPRVISPQLVLIHTFAHILIRQLAFECGYDSSSMRERLYVSETPDSEMSGLLIYTASGDSEGTLGGLVRQGEPGRLDKTIRAAVKNSVICSSDPLCIESVGQGSSGLNLASCHACGLLPETSCEEGNSLLDRALLLGTPEDPSLGFFGSLLRA